ncbi:MAG TPA: DUF4242 domain-containing protein [Ramlibacter sp.]|nr:DUF4242 domain-containing protein [Ramlibacter sp.]
MLKFLVEREIPNAGQMGAEALKQVAQKSCSVQAGMGPRISWQQSYVADNKLFCVVLANSEEDIREHGRLGGFPVDRISRVQSVIDPATAG